MKIAGPRQPKPQKPILAVRVSQEVLDHLDALEEQTGVPRSEIVERCLTVGIADQEKFVEWLKSSVKGPIVSLLLHPTVLKAILGVTGGEEDPTQRKVIDNVTAQRKSKRAAGKPAAQ